MTDLKATFTYEHSEAGNLYYFAPQTRAPGPFREQRYVNAIVDIASDGTFAGVELIDDMPPLTQEQPDAGPQHSPELKEGLKRVVKTLKSRPVELRGPFKSILTEPERDPQHFTTPTPSADKSRHIETRNDEVGFTEFVNDDGPTVTRDVDGRVAILLDMESRDVVGYRVYDTPTPASGEQMEVVARFRHNEHYGVLVRDDRDGNWIALSDHLAAMEAKDAEIEQLMEKYDKATDAVNDYMIRYGDEGLRAEAAEAQVAALREALASASSMLAARRYQTAQDILERAALTPGNDGGRENEA